MRKLVTLLTLALALSSVPALAAVDANSIGIYFDQTGTNNCLNANPYVSVTAYLVVTNPTTFGISGWECKLVTEPASLPAGLTVTLLGGGLNVLSHPFYQVGIGALGGIGAGQTAVSLASLTTFYLGGPVLFGIGPCVPSSFQGRGPGFAAGNDPGLLVPAVPSSNVPVPGANFTYWVAGINAGPTCPVPNEADSWGSVKALYQ